MCDMVEHKNLAFGASLQNKLVFIVLRKMHVFRVTRLTRLRFQAHHHFDLLLTVYSAVAHSHHDISIIQQGIKRQFGYGWEEGLKGWKLGGWR